MEGISWCREGGRTPTRGKPRRILSPLRLPVPPSRLGNGINRLAQVWKVPKSAGARIVPTFDRCCQRVYGVLPEAADFGPFSDMRDEIAISVSSSRRCSWEARMLVGFLNSTLANSSLAASQRCKPRDLEFSSPARCLKAVALLMCASMSSDEDFRTCSISLIPCFSVASAKPESVFGRVASAIDEQALV